MTAYRLPMRPFLSPATLGRSHSKDNHHVQKRHLAETPVSFPASFAISVITSLFHEESKGVRVPSWAYHPPVHVHDAVSVIDGLVPTP